MSATPLHRLCLLGTFRIETAAGETVRLRRRKAETVLAYLALHPGPQPREALAALVAGDASPEDARRLLRVLLAELRRALGDELLLGERDTLALDSARLLEPDTALLAQHLAGGSLEAALALCRGPLLAGLDDEWIQAPRQRLQQQLVDALDARIGHERAQGAYDQAMAWARRLLEVDPAHERAHQHLMFCLLASGDRQGARQQYAACRAALAEQLGTVPSADTEALRQRAERLADAAMAARPTNLPRPLTSFVGREQALETLAEALEGTRLLTLTGMGGHGKTRLAIQLADEASGRFEDGVWWLELAPLGDDAAIHSALARVLGLKERLGEPVLDRVVERLDGQQVLLVLDNAEHLLAACARLAEQLLGRCAGLRLLVTSREPLGVAGEHPWPVPPLPLPERDDAEGLRSNAAAQLLLARGRSDGLQLTPENAATVAALCRQLDGIPLAIELAAAQLRTRPLQEVLDGLSRSLDGLQSDRPDLAPRQRTLAATVRWSHDLLEPAEQALFRRLGIFAHSATTPMATVVAGGFDDPGQPLGTAPFALPLTAGQAVEHLLARLADKSLLQRWQTAEGPRSGLLEQLRAFAREQLQAQAELAQCRERHAHQVVALLSHEFACQYTTEEGASLDRLALALPEIRALLAHQLATATTWLLPRRAIAAFCRLCYVRGYFQEGHDWFDRLARHPLLPAGGEADAEIANSLGLILWQSGQRAPARVALRRALAAFDALGETASRAAVHNNLGCVAIDEDAADLAVRHFEEAIALGRQCEDAARTLAMALNNLGAVLTDRRAFVEARRLLEDSLAIRARLGDRRGQAVTLNSLADLALELGQRDRAQDLFTQAMRMALALQDRRQAVYPLLNLVRVARLDGQPRRVARWLAAVSATLQTLQIRLSQEAHDAMDELGAYARTALGPADDEAARAEGRRLSLDDVAAELAP